MINFKKAVALFLSCSMFLTSCSSSKKERVETDSVSETVSTTISKSTSDDISDTIVSVDIDIHSEDYINSLGFTSLDDDDFKRYLEDTVYADLVNQLDSEEYLVENVEAIYISKEYIDELEYNSKENVYFGYKLSELDEAFQGEKYIFTLSKSGETEVVPFEEYDDTYDDVDPDPTGASSEGVEYNPYSGATGELADYVVADDWWGDDGNGCYSEVYGIEYDVYFTSDLTWEQAKDITYSVVLIGENEETPLVEGAQLIDNRTNLDSGIPNADGYYYAYFGYPTDEIWSSDSYLEEGIYCLMVNNPDGSLLMTGYCIVE